MVNNIPYRSQSQRRLFFWKEAHHQLKPGTALEWAHATPSIKSLPERVKSKKPRKAKRAEPSRSASRRKER